MAAPDLKPVVLVVDDREEIVQALVSGLQGDFVVHSADTAAKAKSALHEYRIALMLLGMNLPDGNGVELISDFVQDDPDLAIVMLTDPNDPKSATEALKRGATDFVADATDSGEIARAASRALARRDEKRDDRKLQQWLKDEVSKLRWEAEQEREKSEKLSVETLDALISALEAKDPWAVGHSVRVAELAVTVATHMGFSEEEIEHVRTAGKLHDLGNIGVREEVLTHKGALTEEQLGHVKRHVMIGVHILERIEPLRPLVPLIRGHHERWDGHGYPDGLEEEEIPRGARVLAAAEVFTALTSPRPYQETKNDMDALTTIGGMAGTVLDPAVADALIEVVRRREALEFIVDERNRRSMI